MCLSLEGQILTPYFDDGSVQIYHADCRDVLPALEAVDHVITDPPYDERTHAGARSSAGNGNEALRQPKVIEINFAPVDDFGFVREFIDVARRWVLCFCTMEMIAAYRDAAADDWVRAGFWRRVDGAPQFSGDRPGTGGDAVAIMHRSGRKAWNGGGHAAFWEVPIVVRNRVHPTQKPERLMEMLVADFTDPGDLILDPFMGSGTTLVAAKRLGRRAIGIDLSEKYCAIAAQRLAQGALGLFGETA